MSEDQKTNLVSDVGDAVEQLDNTSTNNEVRITSAADAEGHPVQEVESLCMNCHKNGTTRMLLTRIPYFREVIIMSFECPHCGLKNSEIQPASQIQEKGVKYTLKLEQQKDLNKQVVKSESCACRFIELDFEIPPQRGQLTTIEGLLDQIRDDLESDQPVRKHVDPETHDKIAEFLKKIEGVLNGAAESYPLTFVCDDPSGNSWVEFDPEEAAHKWSSVEYFRTRAQNIALGVAADVSPEEEEEQRRQRQEHSIALGGKSALPKTAPRKLNDPRRNESVAAKIEQQDEEEEEHEIENYKTEVQTFNATCPACHGPCPTHMKPVDIPHFKEVIIMSTVCPSCGYKSNEVKTGGAIPAKGRKITLKVDDPDDLARDILKSESCGMQIPELNLDLTPGTLGGRFTTLEGILTQVYEELESKIFNESHDSMDVESKNNWKNFFANLQAAINGDKHFTVIMIDPLAGSYIQNVYAPDPDPNMTIEDYERTHEQNEDLGLNDMKV
ncbi:zinc finger chaperone Zpr1p [Trichomonascus vanleenenianus]|uniref:zinc finger-containing protein ZPR1 n=1 Tax=Trichomonascus vanleenenianus TaxID=2268995 RepID=UPI003ECB4D71